MMTAFWMVSILFIITPGVDWAYAIAAGLHGRVVVPAVTGLLLGHLAATLIVAAGVGALLASAPLMLMGLTVSGAAYLLWLGLTLFAHPATPNAGTADVSSSRWHWIMKGACTSGMNPKVFLLFLALLPQFTNPRAALPVSAQIVVLGLIHLCSSAVIYLLVGFSAQAVLQTRPRAARTVSRFSGAAMITIAVLLFAEQSRHVFS
jgi:threonine/homoserine/homoserine lactone efflux protein